MKLMLHACLGFSVHEDKTTLLNDGSLWLKIQLLLLKELNFNYINFILFAFTISLKEVTPYFMKRDYFSQTTQINIFFVP